jgi:hydroxymethylpyrimidine pyrophosphatase-like HAD family hydrolase
MKYKAIFLDLDGTTIPNGIDALPSVRVADAIHLAKNKVHVCLATARPLYKAKYIIDHLDLSGVCIASGGTQIYDPVSEKIVKEVTLDKEALSPIIAIAKKYGLDYGILNGQDDGRYKKISANDIPLGVYFPVISPDTVDTVARDLKQIPNISIHKMPSWEKGFVSLDMTDIHASKLHGIVFVQKMLHLKKKEIIGVGDSYNDFPLLMACGLKIAMGNAIDELKSIADFIAPSVSDDGVAVVIEKFILQM